MGWKNIKTHYRIEHIVQMDNGNVCIGSSYIQDVIVVDPQGRLVKEFGWGGNDELTRYQQEIAADAARFRELLEAQDTFDASLDVYTYHNGEILLKQCEAYGYPNVTHDGTLMYENTFSPDKAVIVAAAKRQAKSWASSIDKEIERIEAKLAEARERRAEHAGYLARLDADYPDIPAATV